MTVMVELDIEERLRDHVRFFFSAITKDDSTKYLISANLIAILMFIFSLADISTIVIAFYIQFLSIGLIGLLKILTLKNKLRQDIRHNHDLLDPSKNGYNILFALFFSIHFSLFCIIVYLCISTIYGSSKNLFISLLLGLIFFYSHLFAFIKNQKNEKKSWDISMLMPYPYYKILPIFLILSIPSIYLIPNGPYSLFMVLILKATADLLIHLNEHKKNLKSL